MGKENTVNPINTCTLTVQYYVQNSFDNEDIVFRLLFRQLVANFEDRGFNRDAVLNQEIKLLTEKSMQNEARAYQAVKREGE